MTSVDRYDNYYFRFMLFGLVFLLINFSEKLGLIYVAMLVLDHWWTSKNKHIAIRIEKTTQGRLQSLAIGAIATGVFFFITQAVLKVFSPELLAVEATTTQSLFHLLAAATPILAGSKIFTLIAWGGVVAIVETKVFFGTLYEGIGEWYNKRTGDKINIFEFKTNTIFLMLVIASCFSIFHMTSKGIRSILLAITFIFAMIQLYLIQKFGHLREAIFMHIFTNTLAVLYTLGWMPDI